MSNAVKRKAPLNEPLQHPSNQITKSSPTKLRRTLRKHHALGQPDHLTLRRAETLTVEQNDPSDDAGADTEIADAATSTNRDSPLDLDTVCSFIAKEDKGSAQVLKIPSGLTKLALAPEETIDTTNVSQSDLINAVGEEEFRTAFNSLKDKPTSPTAIETVHVQCDSSRELISGTASTDASTSRTTLIGLDTVCSFISKENNNGTVQRLEIPSGLTRLALASGETINTSNLAHSDLIDAVDKDEMTKALDSLKYKATSTTTNEIMELQDDETVQLQGHFSTELSSGATTIDASTIQNTPVDLNICSFISKEEIKSTVQSLKIPPAPTNCALPTNKISDITNISKSNLIKPVNDDHMIKTLGSLKTVNTSKTTTENVQHQNGLFKEHAQSEVPESLDISTTATESEHQHEMVKKDKKQTPNEISRQLELEVAIIVCGDDKRVREKTKEFVTILLELIPVMTPSHHILGINQYSGELMCLAQGHNKVPPPHSSCSISETRVALAVGGDIYSDPDHDHIVSWANFGASLAQIIDRVDNFQMQNGGVHIKAKDICLEMENTLSWTPGCPGAIVPICEKQWILAVNTRNAVSKMKEKLKQGTLPPQTVYVTLDTMGMPEGTESTETGSSTKGHSKRQTSARRSIPMGTNRNEEHNNIKGVTSSTSRRMVTRPKRRSFPMGTKRNEERENIKGVTSPTSHRMVTRPKRQMPKPKTLTTKHSFKAKAVPMKKPVVQTSKRDKAIKTSKESATNLKLHKNLIMKKKPLRENATGTQFGLPLVKLVKWTDWQIAACGAIPQGYSKSDFKRPRNPNGFYRKISARRTDSLPSVLEIGVKLPKGRKIWAMCYMKHCQNKNATKVTLDSLLQKDHAIHKEIERVLKDNCEVYVRWATPIGKGKKVKLTNFEAAISYVEGFDYAWSRHGRIGHRSVSKNGVVLSDNSLQ